MENNNTWIKLYRKIRGWEWYKDSNTKSLFIHLLLEANHENKNWKGHDIKRGQTVIGRKQLSKELGISEQSIRTSLNRLKSTNEITIKSTNKFSIITIVKWEEYQPKKKKSTSKSTVKLTNNQPTTNQQLTTPKELKKEKNVKNIISKDIIQAKPDKSNLLINNLVEILKAFNGLTTLDDTQKSNRQYAYLLIRNKIKPEFKKRTNDEPTDEEISASFKAILNRSDNFHKKNLTNFKYIYYNFNKIISEVPQKGSIDTSLMI